MHNSNYKTEQIADLPLSNIAWLIVGARSMLPGMIHIASICPVQLLMGASQHNVRAYATTKMTQVGLV